MIRYYMRHINKCPRFTVDVLSIQSISSTLNVSSKSNTMFKVPAARNTI